MATQSSVKAFLLGAGVSLAFTLLIQSKLQQRRTKTSDGRSRTDRTTVVQEKSKSTIMDTPDLDLRLIRKAEAVISLRTSAITVVVERCTNDHNYSAILRTAEALGIQNVWIIDPPMPAGDDADDNNDDGVGGDTVNKSSNGSAALRLTAEEKEQRRLHRLFAQNATEWLTVRDFTKTKECVAALRETGHDIWVTDLSQEAVPLEPDVLVQNGQWPLPSKLAIVMGTEAVGCSQEMLDAADLRIYLPLRGFADSLNLSVATALVIHHIMLLEPAYVGDLKEEERQNLRRAWFSKLARQRLLSNGDKKQRKKLLAAIKKCEILQTKLDSGGQLSSDQMKKVDKLPALRESLLQLESSYNFNSDAVDKSIEDLVMCPPEPLSDLRRADEHRVTFVGKNTKKMHKDHWKNMVATKKTHSQQYATSTFFRDRVTALAGPSDNKS